jgi:hypothetical protein
LPRWLGDLIARLLAKAPGDRIASAQKVANMLASRLAELQTTPDLFPFWENLFSRS